MKLICENADCEHVCPDFEAAGPYLAPECPRCYSPLHPFDAPQPHSSRFEVEFMPAFTRAQFHADNEASVEAMRTQVTSPTCDTGQVPLLRMGIKQAGGL